MRKISKAVALTTAAMLAACASTGVQTVSREQIAPDCRAIIAIEKRHVGWLGKVKDLPVCLAESTATCRNLDKISALWKLDEDAVAACRKAMNTLSPFDAQDLKDKLEAYETSMNEAEK